MQMGIIKCDEVDIELQDVVGDYFSLFVTLFQKVSSLLNFRVYDARISQFPRDLDECDFYLVTGSRHNIYNNLPWMNALSDFVIKVHEAQKKLVGICFGHQAIAQALGGQVIQSPKGWGLGVSENILLKKMPWMHEVVDKFNLYVSHHDQVVEKPAFMQNIATNSHCENYMLVSDKILTVQGHPEFTREFTRALIEKRKTYFSKEQYDKFVKSLDLQQDGELFAKWVLDFVVA